MTARDEFEQLFRDFVAGKLSRRHLIAGSAAMGAGVALATTVAASAAPRSAAPGLRRSFQDATPVPGGTLRVGMQSDPGSLDAVLVPATALWHVVEHIYNKLTFIQADLSVGLELAETLDISEDGLTYTFKLRPGVMFHNGREMVADDVVFSFKRLADPVTASPSVDYVASMADITASDPSTVVITLKNRDASFLSQIANLACAVVPQEVVAENGDLSQVAVGTGPFTFVEYVPSTSITLTKNATYWETGLPYLDGLELIIASEDTARTTALVGGTVDFIEYAPLRDIEILQADSSLTIAGDSNTNIRFLQFNLSRPPFDDVRVRKAISMVVDREGVLGPATFGHGTPVQTIWPPDHWAALPGDLPAPDIEGAKALLAEAGYPDGFKTTITSWSEYSFLNAAAIVLQAQLFDALNIEAELNLLLTPKIIEVVHTPGSEDYDMAVTGTSGHIDPNELVTNFQTGAGGNTTFYTNPEVDALIIQGAENTDQAQRTEIYHQIQEILLTDLPWVNLFVANQFEAMKNNVKGYFHIPNGSNLAFKMTWLEQ